MIQEIKEIGIGGHFLNCKSTRTFARTEVWRPSYFHRGAFEEFKANPLIPDAVAKARHLIDTHEVDAAVRRRREAHPEDPRRLGGAREVNPATRRPSGPAWPWPCPPLVVWWLLGPLRPAVRAEAASAAIAAPQIAAEAACPPPSRSPGRGRRRRGLRGRGDRGSRAAAAHTLPGRRLGCARTAAAHTRRIGDRPATPAGQRLPDTARAACGSRRTGAAPDRGTRHLTGRRLTGAAYCWPRIRCLPDTAVPESPRQLQVRRRTLAELEETRTATADRQHQADQKTASSLPRRQVLVVNSFAPGLAIIRMTARARRMAIAEPHEDHSSRAAGTAA